MDAGLVKAAKAAIEVLLKLNGTDITLAVGAASYTEAPGGGLVPVAGGTRAPQRFNLNGGKGSGRQASDSGVNADVEEYVLTGRFNAVAEKDDYWTVGTVRYVVDELLYANEFVKKWNVIGTDSYA